MFYLRESVYLFIFLVRKDYISIHILFYDKKIQYKKYDKKFKRKIQLVNLIKIKISEEIKELMK